MPFNGIKFLGATVESIATSIQWGAGPSQLSVTLVEDPAAGDAFSPPSVRSPVYFAAGGLSFSGLLQKYSTRDGPDGTRHDVSCVDPREVLEAAQVVVSDYSGPAYLRNVLNAYGWWEDQAFGSSLANETGMPWPKVVSALLAMTNSPLVGDHGGPLYYEGRNYGLDLARVPAPPLDYRVPGPSISVLGLIETICRDGGVDFFVDLVGTTIRVRTVSRSAQPAGGTVAAIAALFKSQGRLVRSAVGREGRPEPTAAFLVGGAVHDLIGVAGEAGLIRSYWGNDVDGAPILGEPYDYPIKDAEGETIETVPTERFILNASAVADVVGDVRYSSTELEMRAAKANIESWGMFVAKDKPGFARSIELLPTFSGREGAATKGEAVDDSREAVVGASKEIGDLDDRAYFRRQQLYDFVRAHADEYLGRQFLVALPDLERSEDVDTGRVVASYDIADAAYLPEGAEPLGLSEWNADAFRSPDGRFGAFVRFDALAGADLGQVDPRGTAIEDGSLYVKVDVDPSLVFTPFPAALVRLPFPLGEFPSDALGDVAFLEKFMGGAEDASKRPQFGTFPVRIAPATRSPDFAAIPLRSNTQSYGPWVAAGAAGGVAFEHDEGLTPWAYGGFDAMNAAGQARIATAYSDMTFSETGEIEVVGLPEWGLGDVLAAGGPALTSVDVSYGAQGVSTTYRFLTYTPRSAAFPFGKLWQERVGKASRNAQALRRSTRAAARNQLARAAVLGDAAAGRAFLANASKVMKRETPQDVLIGHNFPDAGGSGVRRGIATVTYEEALAFSNAHDDEKYRATAAMSLTGLLAAFCTLPGSGAAMPSYSVPSTLGKAANRTNLDPWGGRHDVDVAFWGDQYSGSHAWRHRYSGDNSRVFGLKGPLVLAGWGNSIESGVVPASGQNTFHPDRRVRTDLWKAGPMDPLWSEHRGTWTVHGSLKGTTASTVAAGGSGLFTVQPKTGAHWQLYVHDWMGTTVPSGRKAWATYDPDDNLFYLTGAACSG